MAGSPSQGSTVSWPLRLAPLRSWGERGAEGGEGSSSLPPSRGAAEPAFEAPSASSETRALGLQAGIAPAEPRPGNRRRGPGGWRSRARGGRPGRGSQAPSSRTQAGVATRAGRRGCTRERELIRNTLLFFSFFILFLFGGVGVVFEEKKERHPYQEKEKKKTKPFPPSALLFKFPRWTWERGSFAPGRSQPCGNGNGSRERERGAEQLREKEIPRASPTQPDPQSQWRHRCFVIYKRDSD